MDPGRRMDGLDLPVNKIEPSLSPSGEPDEAPDEVAWVHQVAFGFTEQAYRGGTCLNVETDGDVVHLVHPSYGDHFTRLRMLKQQYDPANLFRHNLNSNPEVED